MTIEQTLILVLTTGSPLPTSAGDRVYGGLLPQDVALPAVQYQRISTEPVADFDGDTTRDFARIQVDCWATSYGAAKTLAREVRSCIAADASLAAYVESERDEYDEETRLFGVSTDYHMTGAP
jgi:hypothetical protein